MKGVSVIVEEEYIIRQTSIQSQFDFARRAIAGYLQHENAGQPSPQFITFSAMMKQAEEAEKIYGENEAWKNTLQKFLDQFKGGFPERHKDLENRLAQNEVILLVAVFEDLVKSIHREVLKQDPKLLDGTRQIPLGKITSVNVQDLLEEEFNREVFSMDRKSVSDRAKYFDERLKLPWPSKKTVNAIDRISKLRNSILHDDMEKVITGADLVHARFFTAIVPIHLIRLGSQKYPAGFKAVVGLGNRA
jgi:hypothetical protein